MKLSEDLWLLKFLRYYKCWALKIVQNYFKNLNFTIHNITQLGKSWGKDFFLVNIRKFYHKETIDICVTKAYSRYFLHIITVFFQQFKPRFFYINFHFKSTFSNFFLPYRIWCFSCSFCPYKLVQFYRLDLIHYPVVQLFLL